MALLFGNLKTDNEEKISCLISALVALTLTYALGLN